MEVYCGLDCQLLERSASVSLTVFSVPAVIIDGCSGAQSCPILWDPMDCSMPGFPVVHCLPEFAQTHVHWVGDAIQPSHPLSPPSPSNLSLSQHQGFFQWVSSSHQEAKVFGSKPLIQRRAMQRSMFRWVLFALNLRNHGMWRWTYLVSSWVYKFEQNVRQNMLI